jgi:hypothetical protein
MKLVELVDPMDKIILAFLSYSTVSKLKEVFCFVGHYKITPTLGKNPHLIFR